MVDNMLSKINFIGDWVFRLAYVNLLWILFSIIGLIVGGLFPATAAMFTVIRKWMRKEQIPVFRTFLQIYRKDFVEANLVGFLLILIGIFIYFDYIYLASLEGSISTVIAIVLIPISFIYISIAIYIFPVFVHYQLKKIEYVKYAFIISLSYPHFSILLLLCFIVLVATFITLPLLIPFLFGSSFSILIMFVSKKVFEKVEKKEIAIS